MLKALRIVICVSININRCKRYFQVSVYLSIVNQITLTVLEMLQLTMSYRREAKHCKSARVSQVTDVCAEQWWPLFWLSGVRLGNRNIQRVYKLWKIVRQGEIQTGCPVNGNQEGIFNIRDQLGIMRKFCFSTRKFLVGRLQKL